MRERESGPAESPAMSPQHEHGAAPAARAAWPPDATRALLGAAYSDPERDSKYIEEYAMAIRRALVRRRAIARSDGAGWMNPGERPLSH
jgi:hypothetical protein